MSRFAVLGELGNVIGDAVVEGERALLDEEPHRRGGDHLGVGIEQPKRVVARRNLLGFEPRRAEAAVKGELAAARERDLRAGIAALGNMAVDETTEAVERGGIEV
jgi:hypothetical protein